MIDKDVAEGYYIWLLPCMVLVTTVNVLHAELETVRRKSTVGTMSQK